MATTGEKIKKAYLAKGWNQHKLADNSGIGPANINEIVLGKKIPRNSTVKKIADALGVEVMTLYGDDVLKDAEGTDVGSIIKRRCLENGITFNDLAAIAGLSNTTIRNIVNGRNKTPRLFTLELIAQAIEIPVEELYKYR